MSLVIVVVTSLFGVSLLGEPVESEPSIVTAGASSPADIARLGVLIMVTLVLLLVMIAAGAAIKVFDLSGRRDDEAEWLQARARRALSRDPRTSGLTLTPTVHVPVSRRAPVIVELRGTVETDAHRVAAVAAVTGEIAHVLAGRPFFVEDRFRVVPAQARVA
jgi:hypothetical protein